ncbi:MAG: hypothetical protein PVI26_14075 [Chitinispirillia bacterium]|jgi:hypothetical protein
MKTKIPISEIKGLLKRFIVNLFTSGAFEKYDVEIAHKITMIHIISTLGILCLSVFGLESMKRGDYILGGIDFIVGILFIIAFI